MQVLIHAQRWPQISRASQRIMKQRGGGPAFVSSINMLPRLLDSAAPLVISHTQQPRARAQTHTLTGATAGEGRAVQAAVGRAAGTSSRGGVGAVYLQASCKLGKHGHVLDGHGATTSFLLLTHT